MHVNALCEFNRNFKGTIVNIGSVEGLGANVMQPSYNASKAALVNFTRALALEHSAEGIRANCVCPGAVLSHAGQALRGMEELMLPAIPIRRYGETEELAAAISFLASDDASYITGAVLPVDGGMSAKSGNADLSAVALGLDSC